MPRSCARPSPSAGREWIRANARDQPAISVAMKALSQAAYLLAFALEAGLERGVGTGQVERDLAQERQVPGGVAVPHSARVLTEADVEDPMQPILHAPVPADGHGQCLRRGLSA